MDRYEHEFKPQFARRLLEILIQKFEQSKSFQTGTPGKQRPQIVMTKSPFAQDYNDEMDFRKREWMNEAIEELERQGIIESVWEKYRANSEADRIYLQWESVEEAYRLSGIVPLREKLNRLRKVLAPLSEHPWEWVSRWQGRVDDMLEEGKSASLDLDDADGYEDLVRALQELPLLNGRVESIRIMSQRIFQDSKHLERRVVKRLVSLAKQASDEQRDTEEEWLDLLGLSRNPQTVWLTGPLVFRAGNDFVSTAVFPGGIGLSSRTIDSMTDLVCSASRLITIENLTSYHQWIGRQAGDNDDELVIYIGGFPHRTLQTFLSKLSAAFAGAAVAPEMRHWGDIDLGGIKIFKFLQANFLRELLPFRMDTATLRQYESQAAAISSDYAEQLGQALADEQYADWREVLQYMLDRGIRLEQESIVE